MQKSKVENLKEFNTAVSLIMDMLTAANLETQVQMQIIVGDLVKLADQCVREVKHDIRPCKFSADTVNR